MGDHTHGDHHHHHHHDHHGPLESYDHVRGGAPVIDIGGDVGAMVALVDAGAAGTELHLRSEHDPPISIHTGVWERQQGKDTVHAAVFAELREGTYWVLDDVGNDVRRVDVTGGAVAQIDLRA